ncbi:DegT/DnrJ/EryC1/StrS family aminotransferase [Aquimarina sp. ERC-38]|uniref:DegT/DnrJ/EryC1/StrS family aminotransferase n=1 Tax=Aquimarina sp. ERC-38 TaxID=2949996 RepID=UPI0022457D10|nr:DegT/DnrJ/EryC1/StrS family aminotransferase [Aquimarina sp. ERC-38]UZO81895.1 DegT/DnrJ/EryC1/StrS family aminotransferase [Aquimarina sp. ERC-38]
MHVPLFDLQAQYQSIQPEIDGAISKILDKGVFIGGDPVRNFEEEFKAITGEGFVISCANGTDSMELILQAMEIGPGDEVIVPAHTWISTSEVVVNAGAIPIFVDVNATTFCLEAEEIKKKLTPQTKAVIVVHLYGYPAPMEAIINLSKCHHFKVIEDCAQAHGSKLHSQYVGTYGDAASYSFYPTKNLGCYGDGGAVFTKNADMADKIRMIANYGQKERHTHLIHGRNSRLDTLQAAVLSVKLNYLEKWIKRKVEHAAYYLEKLADVKEISLPMLPTGSNHQHSWHLFVIRATHRQGLQEHLRGYGIVTAVHYPKAIPFQPSYQRFRHQASDFPVASKLQDEVLSLPMYAELTEPQLAHVVATICTFYKEL